MDRFSAGRGASAPPRFAGGDPGAVRAARRGAGPSGPARSWAWSARPRVPQGLTAAERRVAELTASGLTNQEVAAAAFLSRKTVEANLTRIYRKLGICPRAPSLAWLAERNGAQDDQRNGA